MESVLTGFHCSH